MSRWDVIVVGVGAVGSAALRRASEAGARVLGIERYTPANLKGSSHGHSRIFRHAYFEHPDYVPLLRHATARFESLERESGRALLHRCGMLLMGRADAAIVLGSIAAARRWALPVDALDATALRARFPWFAVTQDAIGAFEANAGIVRPEAAVNASVAIALGRGAELRTTLRVREVREDAGGVTVVTDEGTERGASAIIAAGPWAATLVQELGPLLRVTRQVQAWMAPAPGTDASSLPCWLLDRGPNQRPLYGLARDPLAPSRHPKVAFHGSDTVVDPEAGAAPVSAADIHSLHDAYRVIAPSLAGQPVDAATCLYTMSPDEHFIVGTRNGCRRTLFAAGLSGHGFKLAPALGDALVDLALRGRTDLPVDFLSPDRFTGGTPLRPG